MASTTENEELVINGINAAGEIINDVTLGEYDLVVSSRPARDNYEDAQFSYALQMREAGVMIPDDVVIRHSPLDDKDEIADSRRQSAGRGTADRGRDSDAGAADAAADQDRRAGGRQAGGTDHGSAARAAQQYAKAQQLEGEAQIQAMQLALQTKEKLVDLQAKLQMFYDNLENKLQLAQIHSQNKRETVAMSEGTKHSIAELEPVGQARSATTFEE